jgi:pyridoxal phosphate enzyme (YggS family)
MIGHLQRNKARRAVAMFDVIESVDSLRLAVKLNEEAARIGKRMPVFLEVNISGEEAKTGMALEDVRGFCSEVPSLDALEVRGVMGMAPFADDPEATRPYFRRATEIRDRVRQTTGLPIPDLSIGMTQDFEIAIEEGATVVRIGRALYEGVI